MKKFFILLFLFFVNNSYSQATFDFEFIGTIQLSNKDLISFKLNYKELDNGKIVGTAITDIYGNDRTKSRIEGFINKKENKISFRELGNISTKSTSDVSDFCFINLKNAKLISTKNKTTIQGSFIGRYKNENECERGMIYLVSTNYLEIIEKKLLESDKINKHDSIAVIKERISDLKVQKDNNVLNSGNELKINWKSNDIIIEVWDGEREDYDEISISVNDKTVLDRLILKQQKKTIIVPFNGEVNTIKIVGVNEGTSAPCTANVLLKDDGNITPIIAVLKKGQFATLTLVKE